MFGEEGRGGAARGAGARGQPLPREETGKWEGAAPRSKPGACVSLSVGSSQKQHLGVQQPPDSREAPR